MSPKTFSPQIEQQAFIQQKKVELANYQKQQSIASSSSARAEGSVGGANAAIQTGSWGRKTKASKLRHWR
jgi:hypothetical protein